MNVQNQEKFSQSPQETKVAPKIIITVLIVGVAIVGAVVYFAVIQKPTESISNFSISEQSQSADETTEWSTYRHEGLGFSLSYPPTWKYENNPNDDDLAVFYRLEASLDVNGLKMYIVDTEFSTFDDYAADLNDNFIRRFVKDNYTSSYISVLLDLEAGLIDARETYQRIEELDQTVDEQVNNFNSHYSFQKEVINGAQVVFHKRDFYGWIGNIYNMNVWLGNGQILTFASEEDNAVLDKIYRSFVFDSAE